MKTNPPGVTTAKMRMITNKENSGAGLTGKGENRIPSE